MPTVTPALNVAATTQVIQPTPRPGSTIIVPQALPAYIPPTTTIVQPYLGPDVGPVPLFAKSSAGKKPFHKNPLFYIVVFALAWYMFG